MTALTLANAEALLAAARARAKSEFGKPVCIAICDAVGLPMVFAREDGAPVRSIRISQGKAYSAARMGVSTQAILERLKREGIEIGYFCDPELTALPGGTPLRDKRGVMLGAIGVSGLTSAEDQAVTDFVAAQFGANVVQ
ncbi:MAG TPA: heme-binding protein [Burkholderiales bacterium]|nr:heme-binding protein [Burkholderiales bacterium]